VHASGEARVTNPWQRDDSHAIAARAKSQSDYTNSPERWTSSRPLKNVGEAAETRQKRPKKRSLRGVNEHFEAVFNAVSAT